MNYSIEILKQEAYRLQKSKDNLARTLAEIKDIKNKKKEHDDFIYDYDSTTKLLNDRIDSLYHTINYLSRSSLPLNCRSDIEDSTWVKVIECRNIRMADQFVEDVTPIVGAGNVKKCQLAEAASFIIFVSAKAINEYHDKIFGTVSLYLDTGEKRG